MYASTFVIVSPTDYQNILAELRSPAALHSDPQFLEAELPVTPNLSPVHHQDCPQHLPWNPETQPSSRDQDTPPRSPPRPRELVLSVRLPDPVPPKVRKPHIALNDQLLLSEEEEDRVYQELELSCKPRSQPLLAACEFDSDMVPSTSSPSLTSLSSITPSSPERLQGQTCVLDGRQGIVGSTESKKDVKMELEKAAGMVATELEGNVEKWLKPDLIKNVDRKCEMIMKGRCKGAAAEANASLQQGEESLEKEILVEMKGGLGHVQDRSEQGSDFTNNRIEPQTVTEFAEQTAEGERFEGGSGENVHQSKKEDAADEKMQLEDREGLAGSQRDVQLTSEGDVVAETQAWVDHPLATGSSEEEEEGGEELPEGILLEVVEKEQGTEEKKELRGTTKVGLEQTKKEMLSLVGWHSDSSSVNVEPPTPGRSVSSDLLDRRER